MSFSDKNKWNVNFELDFHGKNMNYIFKWKKLLWKHYMVCDSKYMTSGKATYTVKISVVWGKKRVELTKVENRRHRL